MCCCVYCCCPEDAARGGAAASELTPFRSVHAPLQATMEREPPGGTAGAAYHERLLDGGAPLVDAREAPLRGRAGGDAGDAYAAAAPPGAVAALGAVEPGAAAAGCSALAGDAGAASPWAHSGSAH